MGKELNKNDCEIGKLIGQMELVGDLVKPLAEGAVHMLIEVWAEALPAKQRKRKLELLAMYVNDTLDKYAPRQSVVVTNRKKSGRVSVSPHGGKSKA